MPKSGKKPEIVRGIFQRTEKEQSGRKVRGEPNRGPLVVLIHSQ